MKLRQNVSQGLRFKPIVHLILATLAVAITSNANAFQCSIFEGENATIPSFKTEIAELKNMHKSGRHIKVIVPKRGPVQEFNLDEYVKGAKTDSEVKAKLSKVAGSSLIYIDLYPIEKRYEIRIGLLTTDLNQVIKPTVYANFSYNNQHNEVYDLQNKIAVFCN